MSGVVVRSRDGRWVVMAGASEPRRLAPARLGEWEPWWAMTIHKSQGSEFSHAVVALPTVDSPILTRELLYTAVTRAKPEVTVVGSEEIIRLAISRPVARASGLRDRLWPGRPDASVPPPERVVRLDRVVRRRQPVLVDLLEEIEPSGQERADPLQRQGQLADALVVELGSRCRLSARRSGCPSR